jgi:hypothetical protein
VSKGGGKGSGSGESGSGKEKAAREEQARQERAERNQREWDEYEARRQRQAPPAASGSQVEKAASVLGISMSAEQGHAKAAWRRLAVANHPDRGGDLAKAKEVNSAWDVYRAGRGW